MTKKEFQELMFIKKNGCRHLDCLTCIIGTNRCVSLKKKLMNGNDAKEIATHLLANEIFKDEK